MFDGRLKLFTPTPSVIPSGSFFGAQSCPRTFACYTHSLPSFDRAAFADVMTLVCAGRYEHEILRAVVVSDSIDMMDDFLTIEITANYLFHDEPMFQNVPLLTSKRVVRYLDENVAILVSDLASLPSTISPHSCIPTHLRQMLPSISTYLAAKMVAETSIAGWLATMPLIDSCTTSAGTEADYYGSFRFHDESIP